MYWVHLIMNWTHLNIVPNIYKWRVKGYNCSTLARLVFWIPICYKMNQTNFMFCLPYKDEIEPSEMTCIAETYHWLWTMNKYKEKCKQFGWKWVVIPFGRDFQAIHNILLIVFLIALGIVTIHHLNICHHPDPQSLQQK